MSTLRGNVRQLIEGTYGSIPPADLARPGSSPRSRRGCQKSWPAHEGSDCAAASGDVSWVPPTVAWCRCPRLEVFPEICRFGDVPFVVWVGPGTDSLSEMGGAVCPTRRPAIAGLKTRSTRVIALRRHERVMPGLERSRLSQGAHNAEAKAAHAAPITGDRSARSQVGARSCHTLREFCLANLFP